MRNVFKWIFLFGPLLGWLCLVGACFYQNFRVGQVMHDPHGVVWQHESEKLVVEVEAKGKGEVTSYHICIRQGNRCVYEFDATFDSDMWGGGFIKAIQADGDSDMEILIWGRREGGWVLDHQAGRVIKKSFDQVPERIKRLAENWYDSHYFGIIPLLFLPVGIIYYLGYGLVRLFIRARKNKLKDIPRRS